MSEFEFWDMTIAEINRWLQARFKEKKREERERAAFDYVLASLVVRGFSKSGMPGIHEAYPTIFNEMNERVQAQRDELSAIRFKQFAQSHNKRIGGAMSKE